MLEHVELDISKARGAHLGHGGAVVRSLYRLRDCRLYPFRRVRMPLIRTGEI